MITFRGRVWRIVPEDQAHDPKAPARAPEGRFHHDGQWAAYTSLTLEGAGVAIRSYLEKDDRPRVAFSLGVKALVVDLRELPDPTKASMVWQTRREMGQPAPTWVFSDAARAQGATGVLYPSRSRPELTHLTLFEASTIRSVGKPVPWTASD